MKLTENKLRRIIREEIQKLTEADENEALDAGYVLSLLMTFVEDESETEAEEEFFEYLYDRVNQSYPDGDITIEDLYDIASEPMIRDVAEEVDGRDAILYFWETI